MQKTVTPYLSEFPAANPLKKTIKRLATLPKDVLKKWPAASLDEDAGDLPIDHGVYPTGLSGGAVKGLVTAKAVRPQEASTG